MAATHIVPTLGMGPQIWKTHPRRRNIFHAFAAVLSSFIRVQFMNLNEMTGKHERALSACLIKIFPENSVARRAFSELV
jgi:hypothetical protein